MAKLSKVEKSAQTFEHLVEHDAHGYSQIHREGDGTVEVIVFTSGEKGKLAGGDGDCSEDVRRALATAGILEWDYWDSYMWTGNEVELLKAHDFVQVDLFAPERGDVLWRHGHTGMYLGNDIQGEALRSENHSIDGQPGDQDGGEVCYNQYNPYEWESAWRYAGEDYEPEPEPKPEPTHNTQEGDEMICIIQPDGKNYLEYFDGTKVHPLAKEAEADAIREVYRKTHGGKEIPVFALGSKKNPVATHLHAVLKREQA